jgi:hypothetical protein
MIRCELIGFQTELGTRFASRSVELDDAQSFVAFEKISTVNGNYHRNYMNTALRFLLKTV